MISIKDSISQTPAKVTADGNLQVVSPTVASKAGFERILSSDGSDIDVTENNFLRVSTSALVLYEQVDGNSINTNLWMPSAGNSASISQASGFITLNGGTAANGYSILQSIKAVPLYGTLPLLFEANCKVANVPESNATIEIGMGVGTTTSAPTDGVFFRWTPTGGFSCIMSYAGAETSSGNIAGQSFSDNGGESITLSPSVNNIHLYAIEIVEDHVRFFIDDILVSDLDVPQGQAFPTSAGRQAVFFRVYNGGSAPSLAPSLGIGQVTVKQEDLYQNKTWGETLSVIGRNAYQSPISAFGQTAQHTNSTAPGAAVLSNTAPSYATLGGKYLFSVASGVATDFALFGFQVPAGFQLFVTDVTISAVISTGLGITASIVEWALGLNSSAASLATADGSGTWAPRRIPIGIQAFPISSLAGAQSPDIVRHFSVPLVVDSGRYFHVILALPTSSATGAIRGAVMVNGYFE